MNMRELLAGSRLVPVAVIDDADVAPGVGSALRAGGLRLIEVTFRTDAAEKAIRALADSGELTVGAGTVVNPAQVDRAVDAGAQFIVSPGFSAAVVRRAIERGVPVMPGVADATEIMAALELGIDLVKVFPASVLGGAATIAALSGPFPQVGFVPTGGIGPANLAEYLSIPQVVAVGGSWMLPRAAVIEADYARIGELAASAVAATEGI